MAGMKIAHASRMVNQWNLQQKNLSQMSPATAARCNNQVKHWEMMLQRLRDIKGRRDSNLPSRRDVRAHR